MPVNYKAMWNKLTRKKEVPVGIIDEIQNFQSFGFHSVDRHESVVVVEINRRWTGVWGWSVGNVGGSRFSQADALSSALNTLRVLCDGELNLPYMIKITSLED
ncbi:hypothetical protein SEA_WEASELS2_247 [Rhodococcus phage Weasels2]|uniref:Uncharacterized protein n=1 Tax=Rhodococcus phage Weasels2 TaxID=1897437 RepID=A0A1I9SAL9_9CAUD|nr:hypothetical protein FDH04_gp169 [Rhodococcus phage Weasels2]AOZ63825.1 hypothetical protein SEA_WEASELS2_247 [Rhodococcus phage Weasels2]